MYRGKVINQVLEPKRRQSWQKMTKLMTRIKDYGTPIDTYPGIV
jgi:hypothetical protein